MQNLENRELPDFLKSALGVNLKEYSELTGIPYRTIQGQWNSDKGRKNIINDIHVRYLERFYTL
jgi:hypothetical protein